LGFIDILDILVFALCLYFLYKLIKGSVAFYIAIGLVLLFLLSLLFRALNMNLMGSLVGQFTAIGFILLIIVFQPEIRRFLLMLGSNLLRGHNNLLVRFLKIDISDSGLEEAPVKKAIIGAVNSMSVRKTGALIVFANEEHMPAFKETGIRIDARISQMLLETIFEKKSPLHDGAVMIVNNRIHSASCILPLSYDPSLPLKYGLRHRAAIGASEAADILSIVISEESGIVSCVRRGKIEELTTETDIENALTSFGY
jgi:diadenylate cyclase